MANTVVHLVIAKRILENIPMLIKNKKAYYLGSIAVDAIGGKVNSTREDKKRVHLRQNIRDVDWLKEEYMNIFNLNIEEFVNKNIISEEGEQRDFNIGYLIHLLVDKINHMIIRQKMLKIASLLYIEETSRDFYNMMVNELEAFDNIILNKELKDLINDILKKPVEYYLKDYIEKEYIENSIDWWKNIYFPSIKSRKLNYLKEEDFFEFIDIATREIKKYLLKLKPEV